MAGDDHLPDDVETLKAMLLAERERYRAELREQALRIEQLKQRIANACVLLSGSTMRTGPVNRQFDKQTPSIQHKL